MKIYPCRFLSSTPLRKKRRQLLLSATYPINGNTLICEGMHGRLFQVTPEGEIVWKYLNPHFEEWADHHTSLGKGPTNWVFKAQPAPYDWVPDGIPHSENPVIPPKITEFRIG